MSGDSEVQRASDAQNDWQNDWWDRLARSAFCQWVVRNPSLALALAMLASIAAVYLGFWRDLSVVPRYWDGPLYLYVAKMFYQIPVDHPFTARSLEPSYFALYFPVYPLLIRLLSWLTLGHYPNAMLLATCTSSLAAVVLFHRLLVAKAAVASPLWTALFFCFLPPRWLVYHAVGATEPLFLCFVFAALLADHHRRPWLVVLFITLTSLTRVSGILLAVVFALVYVDRRDWRSLLRLPVAGLGVLALFSFYQLVWGDFFAYFTWQQQHLKSLPFALYRAVAERSNHYETEFYFWTYFVYGVGTLALWRQRELFFCSLVFAGFACFLYINDLARMFVPAAPFALLVGFDSVFRQRLVRLSLPLIVSAVLLYAWGIIPHNIVGSETWAKLLLALSR